MFSGAVVVRGFPIPPRPRTNSGLKIPLHMATALIKSPRLHEFIGRFYLKGFSTMLVPEEFDNGVVFWHFYYKAAGERISYLDTNRALRGDVSAQVLRTARHIVGWCSEALYIAGKIAPDAVL